MQKKLNTIWRAVLSACILMGVSANAATTIELSNGSRIIGELSKIHEKKVYLETDFAGTVEIELDKVARIESDEAVSLRTQNGEVMSGTLASPQGGSVSVTSAGGRLQTPISGVASAWKAGGNDPIAAAERAQLESRFRKWSAEIGVDIAGNSGNTDRLSTALTFAAALEGPSDRLDFYGSYKYAQSNDVRAEDEIILGTRYTNFFTEKVGWFIRTEGERDTFEGVQFRSTSAVGMTYRWVKRERLEFETSAGISYRYEDYSEPVAGPGSDSYPGLDFSSRLGWQFADWGKLNNTISYTPSVDDFGDYLIKQDTAVDIPLAMSQAWKLRIGLSNVYNSSPAILAGGERDKLDTTYYVRLLMSWR